MSIISTSPRRRRHRSRKGQGVVAHSASLCIVTGTVAAVLFPGGGVAFAQRGSDIGNLRIVRQVEVSRSVVTPGQNPSYAAARDQEGVFAGEGIRTLKRSQAEVDFKDKSVLRVNERTDLIVQDSSALRNIQLKNGVVWVRVAKGVKTQVETPSATAVARGTVFTVGVLDGGITQLTVLEGVVDITVDGKTVSVSAGQSITVTATPASGGNGGRGNGNTSAIFGSGGSLNYSLNYALPDAPITLPTSELPVEFGGSVVGWWSEIAQNAGVVTTPGSSFTLDLRTSPLTEVVQQVAAQQLNPVNTTTTNPDESSVTVPIDFGRSVYRPGSIDGQPNYDYRFRILDRNETSLAFVGAGAAAALLADGASGRLGHATLPTLSGEAFGFWDQPDVLGARGRIDGGLGLTNYHLEANTVRLPNGSSVRTSSRIDSVLYVDHPLGENVTLFAGRRRFYEGPVFQNQVLSQLIADRYTGMGATIKYGGYSLTSAYLYDSNPDASGAQSGAMISAGAKALGGTFSLNYLRVGSIRPGDGYSAGATYPAIRNVLDLYGEVGRGPDGANLQTYGAYFPKLYQKTDVDLFLEYGYHEGIGHALSVIGAREFTKNVSLRAYSSFFDNTNDVKAGLAATFRFKTK